MCTYAECEDYLRRLEDAVEEGRLRDVVSDAIARIDALIEEIADWACAAENAEWVRGRRRSRPDWLV